MNNSFGDISLCPHQGCAFHCCNFQHMSHILTYPKEIDKAIKDGHSVSHLEIIDNDYYGGMRVRCRARDTSKCDDGYKPLDCASYPFFPIIAETSEAKSFNDKIKFGKGNKCPIQRQEIPHHESGVRELWAELITNDTEIIKWLETVSSDVCDPFDTERYEI